MILSTQRCLLFNEGSRPRRGKRKYSKFREKEINTDNGESRKHRKDYR